MSERVETKRLVLRRLTEEDFRLWLSGDRSSLQDRTGARFPAWLEMPPLLLEELETIGRDLRERGDDPAYSVWLMLARSNGAAAGVVRFSRVDEAVETSYSIYPVLQRIGLATEGVGALMAWLFQRVDVWRLRAKVMPDNPFSIRVAEKLGMHLMARDEAPGAGATLTYELVRVGAREP
jgi:[ribosomal protein S5]-alanine N-acetyltransferase